MERPLRQPSARPAARCATCSTSFDDAAWNALDVVERIDAEAVDRMLLRWPPDECIEVRRCSACGKTIAARRPARR